MASTNKTANLKLSQYVNSDKPSYLQDYNEDMRKIDDFSKNALQQDSGWKVVNIANNEGHMCYRRIGKIVYFFLQYNDIYIRLQTPIIRLLKIKKRELIEQVLMIA